MSEQITMMTYVYETPATVLANIENRKEITKPLVDFYVENNCDSVLIIGSGSSYNGSLCAKDFIAEKMGVRVDLYSPFTFKHHTRIFGNPLILCVSQSGCSTNTLDTLIDLKNAGRKVVAVVGRDDCDMRQYADLTVNWGVGEEKIGYVTKGVTTCAAYFMLFAIETALKTGAVTEAQYEAVIEDMKKAMVLHGELTAETLRVFEANKDALCNRDKAYLIGSGPALAVCTEGSLKLAETCCFPTLAAENEEYLHGPCYPETDNSLVLVIDNNDHSSTERIVQTANGNRVITEHVFAVSNRTDLDDNHTLKTSGETDYLVAPLYKLAVVQTLAYCISTNTNKFQRHPNVNKFFNDDVVPTKSRKNLYMNIRKDGGDI